MKVQILIENDDNDEILFQEDYDISSRDEFRELVYEIEDIKDNIENNTGAYCTITLNFNWDEADELEITSEDCDI